MKYLLFLTMLFALSACRKDSYPPTGEGNKYIITTDTATQITQSSALIHVSIQNGTGIANSSLTLGETGAVWDSVLPLTNLSHPLSPGVGIIAFNVSLIGLLPARTYYICGFAVVNQQYIYGNTVSFKTLPIALATISGVSVYSISQTYAYYQATISSNGGGSLTASGVCWATTPNPTTDNSHTSNGTLTGSFSGAMTGLVHATTYYVRAYAVNAAGTAYSAQSSFKTSN